MRCFARFLNLFFVFAVAMGSVTLARAGDLPDFKGRKIVFATAADYSPYDFIDRASGKFRGFDIDMINEAAKRLHLHVSWKTTDWGVMLQAIRDKHFDGGVDGITITKERKKLVDFSKPYFTASSLMLVRSDENRFSDAKSFKAGPYRVATLAGTSQYYTALNTLLNGDKKNPRLMLFNSFGPAVLAVATGDADAVLTDQVNAAIIVKNAAGKLKILPEVLAPENFGIAFHKGSDLVHGFDLAVDAMKADGTLHALKEKWLVHK